VITEKLGSLHGLKRKKQMSNKHEDIGELAKAWTNFKQSVVDKIGVLLFPIIEWIDRIINRKGDSE
jgi:hypothetical protein